MDVLTIAPFFLRFVTTSRIYELLFLFRLIKLLKMIEKIEGLLELKDYY